MRGRRGWAVFGLTLAAFVSGLAGPAMAQKSDRLSRAIEGILKRDVFAPAIVAIDIRDLDTGRVLFERNSSMNVKPGSTMKLFTTAAILDAEGGANASSPAPGSTDQSAAGGGVSSGAGATTLETAGRLDSFGRVLGDLYLVGRGDPNLSDRVAWRSEGGPFDQLAADLTEMGVRRIEGGLIGHDALFPDGRIPEGWTVDDLVWSYGAEVSALSAFDNSLRLRLEPGERDGEVGRLSQWPQTDFIRIENRTITAAEGESQNLSLERPPGSRRVFLAGRIPRLGKAWTGTIAVPEPALFAATLLGEALHRRGVSISEGISVSHASLPQGLRPLASIRGPGIEEQISVVNKHSQNLHAETLLHRLGLAIYGEATVASGLRALEAFLRARKVRMDGAAMYDGSGLSRADLVSARAEVDLLTAMARHPLARAYKDSLAIAGVDGTLTRRMVDTRAKGRVFAKTGTLRHVDAIAGFVDAISGRHIVFSMIVNHHTRPPREATGALDEICALLAEIK